MPTPETVQRTPETAMPNGYSGTATGTLPFKPRPPAPTPRRVGLYELLERIGHGGLGDVYRARHPGGGEVALKLLRDGDAATPMQLRSFERELNAARRLSHPGILPILDDGTHDGAPYYVMPLVRGGSLERKLRAGRLPLREAVALLAQVAHAVHAAHALDVIHRDLKPANVLLNDDGTPIVADFGLARFLNQMTAHTMTGQLMGSVPYMAPEQAAGRSHTASPATDVWALGVMLYELLVGERPFRGETQTDVLHQIQYDEPATPAQLSPDVPAELEQICLRCLRKKPRDRYAAAGHLAADLARWLAGDPVAPPPEAPPKARTWSALVAACVALFVLCWLLIAPSGADTAPGGKTTADELAQTKLRKHLAQAAPGKPVELLSDKQRPIWERMVVGERRAKRCWLPEQILWLHTPERCQLELLPDDPKRGDFRLTLEFTLRDNDTDVQAGLYVAHRHGDHRAKCGAITQHAFAEAAFPEASEKKPSASLYYSGFLPFADGKVGSCRSEIGPRVELPAGAGVRPLRSLTIECREARVGLAAGQQTSWPDKVDEKIALTTLERHENLCGVLPFLSPTAPAGIVLRCGDVRVRRVLYEPLPAQR